MAERQGGNAIPTTMISLGTATPGGGFPLYGRAFAEVINAQDPTLLIVPRGTKGSNENIPLGDMAKLTLQSHDGCDSRALMVRDGSRRPFGRQEPPHHEEQAFLASDRAACKPFRPSW